MSITVQVASTFLLDINPVERWSGTLHTTNEVGSKVHESEGVVSGSVRNYEREIAPVRKRLHNLASVVKLAT